MSEPIEWPEDGSGAPRSPRFGDTYFSAEDGLAETRAVFLDGCGLPMAWAGRRRFAVGELGFGTGLNVLALLDLWRRARPSPDARLLVFSIEAYPMSRVDAATALARWPELQALAEPLLAGWPEGRRGLRRIDWPALGATLDLAIDEAVPALRAWTGRADAWFLDGFAPARNPQMWRDEVLELVATRSARGARAASFTVAGAVRRGLEAQGFSVERVPGFGRKKQRLEARRPGAVSDMADPRIAILGAGIGGAALAAAFARLGAEAQMFDAAGPGAGASGNPAALVTPRLDAGFGPAAELHAQAFARAVELYEREAPEAVIARGVLQLETAPRDAGRFDKLAGWGGFDPGALERLDPATTAARLGETTASGAIAYRDALVVEPQALLRAWLPNVRRRAVARLEPDGDGWRLLDADDNLIDTADVVVVALGHASAPFAPVFGLRSVRGQASIAEVAFTGAPAAWGGYAIPTRTGLLFGATHDRGVADASVRAEDHARNLGFLAQGRPALAAGLTGAALDGRAGVRATTPDHLPFAGAVPGLPGLHMLTGLGGRGFMWGPLLAEALAAEILGVGGPIAEGLWRRLDPGRFESA